MVQRDFAAQCGTMRQMFHNTCANLHAYPQLLPIAEHNTLNSLMYRAIVP